MDITLKIETEPAALLIENARLGLAGHFSGVQLITVHGIPLGAEEESMRQVPVSHFGVRRVVDAVRHLQGMGALEGVTVGVSEKGEICGLWAESL